MVEFIYCFEKLYNDTRENNNSINIIETGTTEFSALCMAKALSDAKFEGSIFTIDVLPHDKMFGISCRSYRAKQSI